MSYQNVNLASCDSGSGSSSNSPTGLYNFAVDSEITSDISNELNKVSEEIDELKGEIFAEIDNLGNAWNGTAYEVFKTRCYEYEPALSALVYQLQAFSKLYSDEFLGSGIESLVNEINAAYEIFKG